jgi:hypothetical protein
VCTEEQKSAQEWAVVLLFIDSSSGFSEIKTRERTALKEGERQMIPIYYLFLLCLSVLHTRILSCCLEHTFIIFPLILVLLMSRDWKHFLVKRFVHVMPWATSSPLRLKCPHYNDFNPLPASLQRALQSKTFLSESQRFKQS